MQGLNTVYVVVGTESLDIMATFNNFDEAWLFKDEYKKTDGDENLVIEKFVSEN